MMAGLKMAIFGRTRRRLQFMLLAAVWVVCLFYMLFQGGKTSIMLFVMVSLLSAYWTFGFAGMLLKSRGTRSLATEAEHGPIQAGSQVRVRFHIEMPRFLPVPYLIVRELLQRHSGESWSFEESIVPHLRSGGELVYQTPPLERGSYTFADTELAHEDLFGLMEHKRTVSVPGTFQVLPRTIFIPRWSLFDGGFRMAGPETVHTLSRRETTQINGVRDYVYGDRLSKIHWNATARTGTWKSKEFEHESMPKTIVVLDCRRDSYMVPGQFELAVSSAASLLEYGERHRIHMGLCTLGGKPAFFPAASGRSAYQTMLYHLVDLLPDGSGSGLKFLESNSQEFRPGTLFVYLTPNTGKEVLDMLAWAKRRQMSSYHIQIGSAPGTLGQAGAWQHTLLQQGLRGIFVASLEDLPAAIGEG